MQIARLFLLTFLVFPGLLSSQNNSAVKKQIDASASAIEPDVISWRRQLHEHPELSNSEYKTADMVAAHLRSLAFDEVRTGVAKTGVVGVLRGGKPGKTIALRADMDALPIVERVALPFASKVRSSFNGQEVGVMHACGHDTHVAMLMGAAEILAGMKSQLSGTIVFLFQPAEEGPPQGEPGGAPLMVKEGCLENPKVEEVYGLHIKSEIEVGKIQYKPGGCMAAADILNIKVKGKGAHGSKPWLGVDPIAVSAQIINGLQYIVSRQMALTQEPCVITIGAIHGGVRQNIVPEEVTMLGTVRTLDTAMQREIHARIRRTVDNIAEANGATAEISFVETAPITFNNLNLTARMLPSLEEVAGKSNVSLGKADTGAEDFAYFARQVPGLFLWLGGMPKGNDPKKAPPHHTADFFVDESGLLLGVRTLCYLAVDGLMRK